MTEQSLRELVFARDPEAVIRRHHAATIDAARAAGPAAGWRPGRPLRLLLAGYVGAANTGADVRSAELVRQLRAILGAESLELGALVMRPGAPAPLRGVRVETMDRHPARFVRETCDRYDGVVACEGSLFTSTFSDDLTALLSACLGYAAARGKLAVAVGAEADRMTDAVAAFVRRQCRDVVVFSRNEASRERLLALGLDARTGTDTGWTFVPEPAAPPHELLRDLGWDGRADVLAVCPVNPFWWPVTLDHRRTLLLPLHGGDDPSYYGSYAFHRSSEDVDRRFAAYLDALAGALRGHLRRRPAFVAVVGMEPLDRAACDGLAQRLGAPTLIAGACDADAIVGVLRGAQLLVSARLHAIILSMSAGVPSIGIAFDGRIPALMAEAGLSRLVLSSGDGALARRLGELLEHVAAHAEPIGRELRRAAGRQLRRQGEMGRALRREVARRHPDFPLPPVADGWRGGLPPLAADLAALEHGAPVR